MNGKKIAVWAIALASLAACKKKDIFPGDPQMVQQNSNQRMNDSTSIMPGRWIVKYFRKNMNDLTLLYFNAKLEFDSSGVVKGRSEVDSATGTWHNEGTFLEIEFPQGSRYAKLNGAYNMSIENDHIIRLEDFGRARHEEVLVLRKLLLI